MSLKDNFLIETSYTLRAFIKRLNKIVYTVMNKLLIIVSFLSIILVTSCGEDSDPISGGTGFITILETSNFITILDENPAEGSSIGSIDAMTNGGSITYTLDSQSPDGAMALNSTTGELTVVDASLFAFETNERITGNFTVTSDDESESGTITINLADVNESEAEVWTGETITFAKEAGDDPAEEANQDRITDNVWITRGNTGGQIYNAAVETSSDQIMSPVDTEWAIGTIDNIDDLDFKPFREAVDKPKNIIGTDLVMHLTTDNIYISLKITSWDEGRTNGGFAYERSTK